jgi:hypothetical protein
MPNILMQSTSVDVVSVNPAAGAESFGQALYPVREPGVSAVTAFGAHAAAEADWGTKATVAHTTATLSSRAVCFLRLVSISPP